MSDNLPRGQKRIILARATEQEEGVGGLFMEMKIAYLYTGFMWILRVGSSVIAILLKAADDDATSTQLSNFGCQFQLSPFLGPEPGPGSGLARPTHTCRHISFFFFWK